MSTSPLSPPSASNLLASALLVAAFSLAGCPGIVTVDGDADRFGPASSTAWVELDFDGERFHYFVVSSSTGVCGALTRAYEQSVNAWDSFAGQLDAASCADRNAALDAAWSGLMTNNNLMYVQRGGGDAESSEPSEGTLSVDDNEVFVFMNYYGSQSPFEALAGADDCFDTDAFEDAGATVDRLFADNGEVTLSEANNDSWRGEFDVDLEDEDGDDVGGASGGFTAASCLIDLNTISMFDLLGDLGGAGLYFTPFTSF